jgi:hypothetical protein
MFGTKEVTCKTLGVAPNSQSSIVVSLPPASSSVHLNEEAPSQWSVTAPSGIKIEQTSGSIDKTGFTVKIASGDKLVPGERSC